MKITVKLMIPKRRKDLDLDTLFDWEPFEGITEEDEAFYRKSYEEYVRAEEVDEKMHIYISLN